MKDIIVELNTPLKEDVKTLFFYANPSDAPEDYNHLFGKFATNTSVNRDKDFDECNFAFPFELDTGNPWDYEVGDANVYGLNIHDLAKQLPEGLEMYGFSLQLEGDLQVLIAYSPEGGSETPDDEAAKDCGFFKPKQEYTIELCEKMNS